MKKERIWLIVAIVVLVILLCGIALMWQRAKVAEQQMVDVVELMNYEKEQLEADYQDIALEMEGFSFKTNNDSLLKKLDQEQKRVQLLLEELRTVKSTNAKRITELKKELASVREVLVYYVNQVDSLNTLNQKLTSENREVRQRYQEATRTVSQLSEERDNLEKKVTLASQLEARNVVVETQNQRGRKTKSIKRVAIVEVSFDILKNISSPIGMKTIYMRITTPENSVLTKSANDVFRYENREIEYSSKKSFEYAGEDMSDVIYYTVDETLWAGNYRVDLFIDGHLVGSANFKLDK